MILKMGMFVLWNVLAITLEQRCLPAVMGSIMYAASTAIRYMRQKTSNPPPSTRTRKKAAPFLPQDCRNYRASLCSRAAITRTARVASRVLGRTLAMTRTVVGLFRDRNEVQAALHDLEGDGITREHISIVAY